MKYYAKIKIERSAKHSVALQFLSECATLFGLFTALACFYLLAVGIVGGQG